MIVAKWKLPPDRIVISDHETHVWRQSLDLAPEVVEEYKKYLNDEELEQGQRFLNQEHQRRYWVSKAALKKILAQYLSLSPLDIEFVKGKYGKPFLKPNFYPLDIDFNMSHSEERAVYVIATNNEEIGIDIEILKHDRTSFVELAERFFAESEYQELIRLPLDKQLLGFYLAWTRKEAYVKAIGRGLSYPLKHFDVSLDSDNNKALLSIEGSIDQVKDWILCSLILEKDYLVSVAIHKSAQHFEFYYSLP